MLVLNSAGHVIDARIRLAIAPHIERGAMARVAGIIVHQTGGADAHSTFNSYLSSSPNGAHFLIDKDGTVHQTASLFKVTHHVGRLKARCVLEKRCTPTELAAYRRFHPQRMHGAESKKSTPDRFPSNQDSIGIELVGEALPRGNGIPEDKKVYEAVTSAQNDSLAWLVRELSITLKIGITEVFTHPQVSWKNPSEASTAKW